MSLIAHFELQQEIVLKYGKFYCLGISISITGYWTS